MPWFGCCVDHPLFDCDRPLREVDRNALWSPYDLRGLDSRHSSAGGPRHGGFSRAETASFMAVRGPDLREAFSSQTPASPADMMRNIELLVGWKVDADATKDARELPETPGEFEGKAEPRVHTRATSSKASEGGQYVEAHMLSVNGFDYLGAPAEREGVWECRREKILITGTGNGRRRRSTSRLSRER